jgi:hypothetical protein
MEAIRLLLPAQPASALCSRPPRARLAKVKTVLASSLRSDPARSIGRAPRQRSAAAAAPPRARRAPPPRPRTMARGGDTGPAVLVLPTYMLARAYGLLLLRL